MSALTALWGSYVKLYLEKWDWGSKYLLKSNFTPHFIELLPIYKLISLHNFQHDEQFSCLTEQKTNFLIYTHPVSADMSVKVQSGLVSSQVQDYDVYVLYFLWQLKETSAVLQKTSHQVHKLVQIISRSSPGGPLLRPPAQSSAQSGEHMLCATAPVKTSHALGCFPLYRCCKWNHISVYLDYYFFFFLQWFTERKSSGSVSINNRFLQSNTKYL